MTVPDLRHLIRSGEARRLRLAAGIPAAAMAQALGIARSSLSNLEHGRRVPGVRLGGAYGRVLKGLANHEAVSRELAGGRDEAGRGA